MGSVQFKLRCHEDDYYGPKSLFKCELSIAQLVGFLVVELAHLGSSPQLDMGARIFLNFFAGFNGIVLSVVCDVSEVSVVNSSISRFFSPTQFVDHACTRC